MVVSEQIKRIADVIQALYDVREELDEIERKSSRSPVKVRQGLYQARSKTDDAIGRIDKVLEFLEEGRD